MKSRSQGEKTLKGKVISVDEKMGQTYVREELGDTLGARDYKQPQAVAYGFKPNQSAKARSLGFEENVFPTLGTSQNGAVIDGNNVDEDGKEAADNSQ